MKKLLLLLSLFVSIIASAQLADRGKPPLALLLKADSLIAVGWVAQPTMAVLGYGDSITEAAGSYLYKLAAYLGGSLINYGVGGSVDDHGIRRINRVKDLNGFRKFLAVWAYGGVNTTSQGHDSASLVMSVKNVLFFLCNAFSETIIPSDSMHTYGTWASGADYDTTKPVRTNTVYTQTGKDSITYDVYADNTFIMFYNKTIFSQPSRSVSVYDNDVLIDRINLEKYWYTQNGGWHPTEVPFFYKFKRNGKHHIRIVNDLSGGFLFIDYAGTLRQGSKCAPALILETPATVPAGWNGATADDWAFVTAGKKEWVAQFKAMGFPAFYVNTNDFYNPTIGINSDDGVHPNASGQQLQFNNVLRSMITYPFFTIATGIAPDSLWNFDRGLKYRFSGKEFYMKVADTLTPTFEYARKIIGDYVLPTGNAIENKMSLGTTTNFNTEILRNGFTRLLFDGDGHQFFDPAGNIVEKFSPSALGWYRYNQNNDLIERQLLFSGNNATQFGGTITSGHSNLLTLEGGPTGTLSTSRLVMQTDYNTGHTMTLGVLTTGIGIDLKDASQNFGGGMRIVSGGTTQIYNDNDLSKVAIRVDSFNQVIINKDSMNAFVDFIANGHLIIRNIQTGSTSDSVLTIVNGVVKKVAQSSISGGSSYITSLTTIGTSGPATVVGGVLNIPQYSGGSGGGSKGFTASNKGVLVSNGTDTAKTYSNFTYDDGIGEMIITGNTPNNPTATFGNFQVQSLADGTTILGNNVYYDNSAGSLKYAKTGPASYIDITTGSMNFGFIGSGTAGGNAFGSYSHFFNADGTVSFAGKMAVNTGTIGDSILHINGGVKIIGGLNVGNLNKTAAKYIVHYNPSTGQMSYADSSSAGGSGSTGINGLNGTTNIGLGGTLAASNTLIDGGGTGTTLSFGNGQNIDNFAVSSKLINLQGVIAYAGWTVISTGSNTTLLMANGQSNVLFNPSSAMSTYTLTLPATSIDGVIVKIHAGGSITSGAVVTSFTISPSSGKSIIQSSAPTTLAAGDCLIYQYNSSLSTWYREK